MSQQIEIIAELREDVGKGASRRLRRLAGKIAGQGLASLQIQISAPDLPFCQAPAFQLNPVIVAQAF